MLDILCNDIYGLFLLEVRAYPPDLINKVHELYGYFDHNSINIDSLEILLGLEYKLMNSKGHHRQFIEKQILQILLFRISFYCLPEDSRDEYLTLNGNMVKREKNNKEKEKYIIALKLIDFAVKIFNCKRARDSFSNKRKSLALEILGNLLNYYDFPEAAELCLLALKSKKKDLILAGLEFQKNYILERKKFLGEEIIELLDKIILQTKDRSVAVSVLDIQVEAGNISELEALSRIDEWKDRNFW